ncbi:MAG: segregation/condensation protein A [Bdellovibrionaceae bacterium]|nr:segregation/condensation protein A [Pseudobdellovibrionaceae bacterium]
MSSTGRYLIHLPHFEGPLALLLYLIRKEEMDIFNININQITKQYLEHIRMMKELDLEVAGEFVAMAATLIQVKARMLLPQYNAEGEVVETEDPRKELVQKLLDYQKYQDGAKKLYERPLLNRDIWARGIREDLRSDEPGEIVIEDEGLFGLIASYRRAMKKAERLVHKVRPKTQSIAGRVLEIKDRLIIGARVVLRDLLNIGTQSYRNQLLITFLSMLELGRLGFVSVFQNEVYGDIHIELKKPIERNVLERVQEFDSQDAEAIANSIITEAVLNHEDQQLAMTAEPERIVIENPFNESGEVADAESGSGVEEQFMMESVDESLEDSPSAVIGNSEQSVSDDELLQAERELGLDQDAEA